MNIYLFIYYQFTKQEGTLKRQSLYRQVSTYKKNIHTGADPGGSLGSGDPPPQHIREAKGMMCCYKNT